MFGFSAHRQCQHKSKHRCAGTECVLLNGITNVQYELSEIGKAILTGQIPKHVLELWNHENQQDCHDHDCHD